MPPVNLCCPKCLEKGVRSQMIQEDWRVTCVAGCQYEDTSELSGFGKLEPFSGKAFTPPPMPKPEDAATFSITMPAKLLALLEERFGDTLEQSFVALSSSMTDRSAFMVSGEDSRRMSELSKTDVKNSKMLTGVLYALTQEVGQMKEQLTAKVVMPVSANGDDKKSSDGIFVRLSVDQVLILAEKAAFNNKSVTDYLADGVANCLEQNLI